MKTLKEFIFWSLITFTLTYTLGILIDNKIDLSKTEFTDNKEDKSHQNMSLRKKYLEQEYLSEKFDKNSEDCYWRIINDKGGITGTYWSPRSWFAFRINGPYFEVWTSGCILKWQVELNKTVYCPLDNIPIEFVARKFDDTGTNYISYYHKKNMYIGIQEGFIDGIDNSGKALFTFCIDDYDY